MKDIGMKHEAIESVTSYSAGFGTLVYAHISDMARYSEKIAIILACIVVLFRAIYDGIRLYRYWRKK